MEDHEILKKLNQLEAKIDSLSSTAKERLTIEEAAEYLKLSKSFIYKATSSKLIPYYKPFGKVIYFEKADLDNWARSGKIQSCTEIMNNFKIGKDGRAK